MSWLSRLDVGMHVHATDGPLGSIASVPRVDLGDPSAPAEVIVLATDRNAGPGVEEFRRVTREMIERVDARNVYLNLPRADVPRASERVAAAYRSLRTDAERLTIPLLQEEVAVDKRVVELGYVRIRKTVEELLDERAVPLLHQEVEVERVPIDRIVPEMIEPYMDGDVYVVPVIEEEVVVTRQLRLREEIRVRRSTGERTETVQTPFRRERIAVQEHWFNDGNDPDPDAADTALSSDNPDYRA